MTTRLLIGGDGYIGWPLAISLCKRYPRDRLMVVDSGLRRRLVAKVGGDSLLPIAPFKERLRFLEALNPQVEGIRLDAANPDGIVPLIAENKPQVLFHLGHQPSGPYSMASLSQTLETVANNEFSTLNILWAMREYCRDSHLIKMGSFGAYAKPGLDIPEGYFLPEYRGRIGVEVAPFPRVADDVYHATKINDANFVSIACRKWRLRVTDVMQSTVFGTGHEITGLDPRAHTRFDYDSTFGTVLNRFVVQAISGQQLSVYGTGRQTTGLMALPDCIEMLMRLAEATQEPGTHRVVNNVSYRYSINELAALVQSSARDRQFQVAVSRNWNPRQEDCAGIPEYSVLTDTLRQYITPAPLTESIYQAFDRLMPYRDRIRPGILEPSYDWRMDGGGM